MAASHFSIIICVGSCKFDLKRKKIRMKKGKDVVVVVRERERERERERVSQKHQVWNYKQDKIE